MTFRTCQMERLPNDRISVFGTQDLTKYSKWSYFWIFRVDNHSVINFPNFGWTTIIHLRNRNILMYYQLKYTRLVVLFWCFEFVLCFLNFASSANLLSDFTHSDREWVVSCQYLALSQCFWDFRESSSCVKVRGCWRYETLTIPWITYQRNAKVRSGWMNQDENTESLVITYHHSNQISRYFGLNFHFTVGITPTSAITSLLKLEFSIFYLLTKLFSLEKIQITFWVVRYSCGNSSVRFDWMSLEEASMAQYWELESKKSTIFIRVKI
jgi:hypothetical protein